MAVTLDAEYAGSGSAVASFGVTGVTAALGRVVAVFVNIRAGSSNSVGGITDTGGNTYTHRQTGLQSGSNTRVELWTAAMGTALAGGTITVTFSTNPGTGRASCSVWNGLANPVVVDVDANAGSAATTTPAALQVLTTDPGALVLAGISYPNAGAPAAGPTNSFTTLSGGTAGATFYGTAAYRIPGSTGTYGPAWTLPASVASGAVTVALEATGGGGSDFGPQGLPTLYVEVDFEAGAFETPTTWTDVTAWVRAGSINRGVSRFDGVYARAEAGTAHVVLDNQDARFDPTNLSGPYVDAGESLIQPMRHWRIRAEGGYDLWRGYADSWSVEYPHLNHDSVCMLRGTDGTKVLANFDGGERILAGEGETTGDRIERILDNANWPAAQRDLDTGNTTVGATTLGQPAWAEVLLVSDTEIGETYFDGAGKLVFRERHAIWTEARSLTPQAVFGDGGGAELAYADIEVAFDDTQIANLVRISRADGVEQTAEDNASQNRYLIHSFVRSDLIHQSDTDSLAYAQYVLSILKDGELRFDSLTIKPQASPTTLYPHALGRELGDRITVKLRPVGRGDVLERDAFIRGIRHDFTPATWVTTWALQDATRFDFLTFDRLTFNHATLGRFNFNAFGSY